MKDCVERESCSLCGGNALKPVLNLGLTALANEFAKAPVKQDTFPLMMVLCETCGHSQIGHIVSPARLFGNYVYATATSQVTVRHVVEQASALKTWYETNVGLLLDDKSVVVEIGSNDSTMLSAWKKLGVGCVVGVDPAAKKLTSAFHTQEAGVNLVNDFFTAASGKKLLAEFGETDIVVANNVFAHVPSVLDVATGVRDLLADGGVFSFEVSYLMDMAEEPLFDTIYHEHTSYHALGPLAVMLDKLGLPIRMAARINEQKGRGSLRVICTKTSGRSLDSATARSLMVREAKLGLWSDDFWTGMKKKIESSRQAVLGWIDRLEQLGEPVVGYGAAAKLTTLMYAFNIGADEIQFIVDDSEWKHGLYTPGKHVPVLPVSRLREMERGTCIIFAWNFAESIARNNHTYKGRFVVPLPELKEIS